MRYWRTMSPRTVLSFALALSTFAPPAIAAEPSSGAAPAQSASGTATTVTGLKVSATVRPEALAGFPVVVALNIKNDTTATQAFPDLAARPHLVRFSIVGPRGKSERYNTPPAFDVATAWTLPARSERSVLLEIPSSDGFPAGDYTITVSVQDPGGALQFAPVNMTIAVPHPLKGTPVWEPTIAQNLGTIFPWVQDRSNGGSTHPAALYLMHFDARAQSRPIAQYWLADLTAPIDPQLSRARPGDSFSRYVYWQVPGAATATFAFGKLEGTSLHSGVKSVSLPYPAADVLDRGVTDAKGNLVLPLWLPSPNGKGGSLKAWTVNERGVQTLRSIVDLPSRPTLHTTAIDAGSNLLLAIAVAGGVDVYRVDSTQAIEIPARGTRHWVNEAGWTPTALHFDVLPDAGTRPGGLSLYTLITNAAGSTPADQWKSQWTDLAGASFAPASGAWKLPGQLEALVTSGYGPTYALSRDAAGAFWYQPQGATPVVVAAPQGATDASLYISAEIVRARVFGGASVVTDVTLGPKQQ